MTTPVEQLTKDGYDLQFGINVLGHFHFTMLLLPCLLNTPNPRVINLTSSAHELSFAPDGLYWNHLKGPKTGSKNRLLGFLERWRYYNQSKLVRKHPESCLHSYLTFLFPFCTSLTSLAGNRFVHQRIGEKIRR